ncbi:MAG TPA: c-type cytochrome domain-containing protein, partial [Planctomycetota bacterium]|nr:c-type cytochrome domain-containing protein [Planctomycetota bacterium]
MTGSMRVLFCSSLLVAAAAAQHEGVVTHAESANDIDFARQVQPILAQNCYRCHGPDDGKRKADMRLDQRAFAFAEREGGAAFVAGKPEASQALVRVLSSDPEERMPPPEAGDALKPAQIEILRRWIETGAVWTEHWAFVKPERPAVPAVGDKSWPRSDVDRFVLARLEREGLRPSAEAPREAWLRRVTFDLIGMPPTIAELDAFL